MKFIDVSVDSFKKIVIIYNLWGVEGGGVIIICLKCFLGILEFVFTFVRDKVNDKYIEG